MDIFVPKNIPLQFTMRSVYPSNDEVDMRCGQCHGTQFKVIVKPQTHGAAKVAAMVCTTHNCARIYRLDDNSRLAGKLEV